MNNKPWWLWEGAAVRRDGRVICKLIRFHTEERIEIVEAGEEESFFYYIDRVTPIENPAVMLAPGLATHVEINGAGWCHYTSVDHDPFVIDRDFLWPGCPDHLKGKTWELPHE